MEALIETKIVLQRIALGLGAAKRWALGFDTKTSLDGIRTASLKELSPDAIEITLGRKAYPDEEPFAPTFVQTENEREALLALVDSMRASAQDTLAALSKRGWRITRA